MRSAGAAALVLVLALGLAPAAGAHHEASEGGEVTHRDTPAELAGADIARALRRAPRVPAHHLVRHAPHRRRHRQRRVRLHRSADQGRLRLRLRPDRPLRRVERRSAGQRLAHRAVPRAAVGRAARTALRHGHQLRCAVRRRSGRGERDEGRYPRPAEPTSTWRSRRQAGRETYSYWQTA